MEDTQIEPVKVNVVDDISNSALHEEIKLMLAFSMERGIKIPSDYKIEDLSEEATIRNYNTLAEAIKPSTVQSIKFINQEILDIGDKKKWYEVPVFAKCLLLALVALIILIGVSLLPMVNEENQASGLLNSSGTELLVNLVFICSASLLGVMFFLLKTISDKMKDYTLLPVDAIEVNSTILIGVISGFIIAELLTFTNTTIAGSVEIQKMSLALLGGFSSDAIFTVLQGIVNKVKLLLSTTVN